MSNSTYSFRELSPYFRRLAISLLACNLHRYSDPDYIMEMECENYVWKIEDGQIVICDSDEVFMDESDV